LALSEPKGNVHCGFLYILFFLINLKEMCLVAPENKGIYSVNTLNYSEVVVVNAEMNKLISSESEQLNEEQIDDDS
jgi:hypothetical protein